MRISKEGKKYIEQFSTFAARIFTMYGFTWGMPLEESYIPTAKQIEENATDRVRSLSKSCSASESGRILARKSDFIYGFELYLNLKSFASDGNNNMEAQK